MEAAGSLNTGRSGSFPLRIAHFGGRAHLSQTPEFKDPLTKFFIVSGGVDGPGCRPFPNRQHGYAVRDEYAHYEWSCDVVHDRGDIAVG